MKDYPVSFILGQLDYLQRSPIHTFEPGHPPIPHGICSPGELRNLFSSEWEVLRMLTY